MPPPSKRRKTSASAVQEINFDPAAREEYLTGFHKRKQARIKHAQEEAAKKEKEERAQFRRDMRKQRKEDLERHVSEVNALLRKANGDPSEAGNTGDNDGDTWEGFHDTAPEFEPINREDEYIDEEKYTTVTIESVGISKAGFEVVGDEGSTEEDKDGQDDKEDGKRRKVWTKERPKVERPKKKKKKFRYESKTERKATRMKQGAKNRAQAQARKEK